MNESALQSIIRRDFAFIGPVWRNNSGAYQDETGRLVRYGLGNESSQINQIIKSSDLIGITPVVVTAEMIGRTFGVFTAIECKPPEWSLKPSDKRALAQARFNDIVKKSGGFAGFATNPNDIFGIIQL